MDEELTRRCRRWLEADGAGRDDEADAAFRRVFAVVPLPVVSPQFATRTMQAAAAASAREARRARRARIAVLVGGAAAVVVGLYFGTGLIAAMLSGLMVGGLDFLVDVIVTSAAAFDRGAGVWTVLFSLGRAAAAFLAEPKVTVALLAVQAIAAAALFALQRLLGTDAESFK